MKKNIYPFLLAAVPLAIIFMAFNNPSYANLVRATIIPFAILGTAYCLFTKDPRGGLILFLIEASMLEGPWKVFTYGMKIKILVYIIRDILLYAAFLNFLSKKRKMFTYNDPADKVLDAPIIYGFILYIVIQLFNPGAYSFVNSIVGSRLFWEMMPLYWMGYYLMRDKKSFILFFCVCFICVFFNSIATILQYNWGPEKVANITEGYRVIIYDWGRQYKETIRPTGLGSDMGYAGSIISQTGHMFILVILLALSIKRGLRKIAAFILISCMLLFGIGGLLFSLSRTSVIIFALHCVVYLWLIRKTLNKKLLNIVFIVIAIGLLTPYAFHKTELAMQRYETIKNPIALAKTVFSAEAGRFETAFVFPLYQMRVYFFGNGLGITGPGSKIIDPENKPKQVADSENTLNLSTTEIGTIGIFLWLFFHIRIVSRGLRFLHHIKDKHVYWYAAIPLTSMIALLTQWQFGQLINFPNNACFWFMAGALMGLRYITVNETFS